MSRRGVALLVVLWTLAGLTVMAGAFSALSKAGRAGTIAFREGVENRFLAEAGVARGILEMVDLWRNRAAKAAPEEGGPWRPDGLARELSLGSGRCTVRISDESGKLSLNGLNDASGRVLINLLCRRGCPPGQAGALVAAILDRRREGPGHPQEAREVDRAPSAARPSGHGDFEVLEEVLSVPGMTPEILYGGKGHGGVFRFLTVHHRQTRIDLRTASRELLEALPGMDDATAARVVAYRTAQGISGVEVMQVLVGVAYPAISPYVRIGAGGTVRFTVEAVGHRGDPGRGYAIAATVALDHRGRHRYLRYQSPAEGVPWERVR